MFVEGFQRPLQGGGLQQREARTSYCRRQLPWMPSDRLSINLSLSTSLPLPLSLPLSPSLPPPPHQSYQWLKEKIVSEDGKKQQAKLKELNQLTEKLGCTLPQLAVGETSTTPSTSHDTVHVP